MLTHHESVDGSGYPDGLKGEEITALARIISIVDSYDAIATVRPYHAPRSHSQVMQFLYDEQGRKYDSHVLAIFAKVVESQSPQGQHLANDITGRRHCVHVPISAMALTG